jgi:hypothetical protein
MKKQTVELLPIDSVTPYPRNARIHSETNIAKIVASIKEFGWTVPILVDEDATVLAGHGRLLAARALLMPQVPCLRVPGLSSAQKRAYRLADNRLTLDSDWDFEALKLELADLDFDLSLVGFDHDELAQILGGADSGEQENREQAKRTLAERFGVPPFSVINARSGWWQERKAAWIALGIKSELGRIATFDPGKALIKKPVLGPNPWADKEKAREKYNHKELTGTSIFDPVLCELVYRWFSAPGMMVLDPFAGGSVRGVVAAALSRSYYGVDISERQIGANREQWAEISQHLPKDAPKPNWAVADALDAVSGAPRQAQLLFSCPPYGDLEQYSDHPRDLSNMPWPEFCRAHREIIKAATVGLEQDSFVCWVVGEVRDEKSGFYRGLVPETVLAFEAAGLRFYNEAILVTMVGTLAVRAGQHFVSARKLGKTHQHVLIFLKGNAKKACAKLGSCEYGETDQLGDFINGTAP